MPATFAPRRTGVERKTIVIDRKAAEAAGTRGEFEAYAATWDLDQGNDRILPGAFNGSLTKRRHRPLLWDHDPGQVVGVEVELREDRHGLLGRWKFADTAAGRDTRALVQAGAVQAMSIGFIPIRTRPASDGVRELEELDLLECSLVSLPMNEAAMIQSFKSGASTMSVAQRMAARGVMPLPTPDRRSLGERLAADAGVKAMAAGQAAEVRVALDLSVKALVTSMPTPADVRVDQISAVPPARDFLSFVPILSTEANIVRVVGVSATNAAAPTAEATATTGTSGLKPESGLTFPVTEVPVESVPTWIPFTTRVLQDAAGLQNVVDSELAQMLRTVVEAQLAAGNGTTPNLHGIATWPGVASVAVGAGGAVAALISAMGAVRTSSGRSPTVIGMESAAWAALISTTGSGSIGSPGLAGPPALYGVPIVPCAGLASGTALVGNGPSAALYERQEVTITVGLTGSQFVRNMVTVLAETRVAAGVSRPSAWRLVTGLPTS